MAAVTKQPALLDESVSYGASWEHSSTWPSDLISTITRIDVEVLESKDEPSEKKLLYCSTQSGSDATITIASTNVSFSVPAAKLLEKLTKAGTFHWRLYIYILNRKDEVMAGKFEFTENPV